MMDTLRNRAGAPLSAAISDTTAKATVLSDKDVEDWVPKVSPRALPKCTRLGCLKYGFGSTLAFVLLFSFWVSRVCASAPLHVCVCVSGRGNCRAPPRPPHSPVSATPLRWLTRRCVSVPPSTFHPAFTLCGNNV